ncbi:MAG TPA: hypothetical protein VFH73_28965 [Polyangia bacterium]|jgi:hypothetical protein|nr:hypothetical protein [Polyangia bacterium]
MHRTKKLLMSGLFSALVLGGLSVAPAKAEAAGWYNCQPDMVFEINGGTSSAEIEVHCINPFSTNPKLDWIGLSVPSAGNDATNRFVSMAQAAILSARKFRVFYTDQFCFGAPSNCRYATSWSLFTP